MRYMWWILGGVSTIAIIVMVVLAFIFWQKIQQRWQAVKPHVKEHLTLAEISLAISILVFLTSPLAKRLFNTTIEHLFVFCAGLSNLVAIIDISRQRLLTSSSRKRVRIVLAGQLLILGLVIGADVSQLIANHAWQMGISFGVAIVSTILIAAIDRPDYVKLGWLTFVLVLSLAIHTNPEMFESIGKQSWSQGIPPYVSLRLHTWAHLIGIPLLYLAGDFILKEDIETSRSFFPWDIVLALCGFIGLAIASTMDNPSADAAMAALLLILGNFTYIVLVNKPRTEMRNRVNREASYWNKWSEALWHRNEGLWIKRNGQDHFYREQVVLPALLSAIRGAGGGFKTLIDLGSGDGYTTNRLLEELGKGGVRLDSVLLVDRSSVQLQLASTLPHLNGARFIQKDLVEDDWADEVAASESPRVILSVFMLQEVPLVDIFFSVLSRVMVPEDICLAVIVDPEYSARLHADSTIKLADENHDQEMEWEWAGEYPITIDETRRIYLPHFQRGLDLYRQIAAQNGLSMTVTRRLSVEDTPEAREVFGHTVYGQGIIGISSSILLTLRKTS